MTSAFADLVEAENSNAAGVFDAVRQALEGVGLGQEELQEKLVMVSLDGASVNQGASTGVGKRFQDHVGREVLVGWCVNHKFELGILDSIKSKLGATDNMIALVEEVVDFVFRFYYNSPRRRRILQHISSILEEDSAYFSGFSGTRWLASRVRAYKALWKHLPAVILHFEEASHSRGDEGVKCTGYLKKLKSVKFVQSLYFLIDALEALEPVSVAFQREDLFVTELNHKLSAALIRLEGLKHENGEKYDLFKANFAGGSLKCGKGLDHVVVLSGSENLGPTEASLHTLVTRMIEALNQRFAFLTTTPYLQFNILDHQVMPPIHAAAQLYMYGNDEIRTLVDHFRGYFSQDEAARMLKQWPDLKVAVTGHKKLKPVEVYQNLLAAQPEELQAILLLVELALTLSPSTAGVERGFSAMKQIKSSKRSRMNASTLSDLMRVGASTTDVKSFNPARAISHWVTAAPRGRKILQFIRKKVKLATGKRTAHQIPEEAVAELPEEDPPLLPAPPPDHDSDSDDDTHYGAGATGH